MILIAAVIAWGASAGDVRASPSIVRGGALTNFPITAIVPTELNVSQVRHTVRCG